MLRREAEELRISGLESRARVGGVEAVYGDATHRDVLAEAGVGRAGALIVTSGTGTGQRETIRLARELNPSIRILVRSAYLRDLAALRADPSQLVTTALERNARR